MLNNNTWEYSDPTASDEIIARMGHSPKMEGADKRRWDANPQLQEMSDSVITERAGGPQPYGGGNLTPPESDGGGGGGGVKLDINTSDVGSFADAEPPSLDAFDSINNLTLPPTLPEVSLPQSGPAYSQKNSYLSGLSLLLENAMSPSYSQPSSSSNTPTEKPFIYRVRNGKVEPPPSPQFGTQDIVKISTNYK